MLILPSLYWGSTEYYAHIIEHGEENCIIDIHEHFIKRSERNRTLLMTANGVLPVTVHLKKANRMQIPINEMEIDYSEKWDIQQMTAIRSAYRTSAYYDTLENDIMDIILSKQRNLLELNKLTFKFAAKWLGIDFSAIKESKAYVQCKDGDIDLRPKNSMGWEPMEEYFQLFSDRFPFTKNLSILDLIMAEGPQSRDILQRSISRFCGHCQ
ncbi:MAG: WbqC family protein [Alistipes sp.]|nr:WbqC family protein [Candidatus Alistipes equi]